MRRNIVFLSRVKRTLFRWSHTFDLRETPKTLFQRLARPFDEYHFGIPWDKIFLSEKFLHTFTAATIMRQMMHAHIVAPFKSNKYDVFCSSDRAVKNSIVILDKRLINRTSLLKRLKFNRNIVVIDIVDAAFKPENYEYADAIMCSGHKAYEYYSATAPGCKTFFVEHCVDIRLNNDYNANAQCKNFTTYYFGAVENFYRTPAIEKLVTPCFSSNILGKTNTHWMCRLPEATLHYAIRPEIDNSVFKPFTKGFIAATCNANILIHKDDGDALHYLGTDYPYLISESLSEDIVMKYLEKARTDYGGPRWQYGLALMENIKKCVQPEVIAAQFWNMIKALD